MSIHESNLTSDAADSHAARIRAAREQIELARNRQCSVPATRAVSASIDAVIPHKSPPGYTLLRELHRGGQGVVYIAVQESTGRQVAIKLLHSGAPLAVRATELARFRREIDVLSRLKHPNVVTIHDCGREGEHVYLVMDYVNGRPLNAYVERGRTPLPETLTLFASVCDGVNAAHLRGVVHRDLKPGNILVDEHGRPRVLDFGLAKLADDSADGGPSRDMTTTGQFVGSLPWASPEQAEGRSDALDIRTDVYSLGVVLYQILTGRFPYSVTGRLSDVVRNIVSATPTRPSTMQRGIDRELETILLKCLAKEPERRYQNAGELASDLRRYLAGQAIAARGDSAWYIVRKQLRQHRGVLLAGCAFVALLIASSITAWTLYAASVQAQKAEQARLWDALVAQARAGRNGDGLGRRIDSLLALGRARDIRYERELRDDAVACLALADLRATAEFCGAIGASTRGLKKLDRFACISPDGNVEVRDAGNNSLIATLSADGGRVVSLEFSRDGGLLAAKSASAGRDALLLWEVASQKLMSRLPCDDCNDIELGDFSSDGRRIAVIRSARGATLFDLPAMSEAGQIQTDFKIAAMDFDAADRRLAIIDAAAPRVAVWDLAESHVARMIETPAAAYVTAWSPDGRVLAVGAEDHKIYLYDVNAESPPRVLSGHRGQVVALGFNDRGDRLASGGWDRLVRVWDMSDDQPLATLIGCRLAGLSDRLAVNQTGHLRLWDFVDVSVVRELRAGPGDCARAICFLGDGRRIAAGGPSGLHLIDVTQPGKTLALDPRNARRPFASADGRRVCAVLDGVLMEWTLTAGESVAVESRRVIPLPAQSIDVMGTADGTEWVACAGSEVVIHGPDGAVLRRAEIGRGIEAPMVSPDGRRALLGNWRGAGETACLIDLGTLKVLRRFPGESVTGAFNRDGSRLAICTPSRVEVWDLASNARRWSQPRESDEELAVRPAFSPDGRIMAISASMYDVRLVDANTGQLLAKLPNPSLHMIGDLEFSSDGRSLAMGTSSSVVHLWDLASLQHELGELRLAW